MAPPAQPAKRETVELCLFTFIPLDLVVDPFGVRYRADGPGFSYERAEYRTRHKLIIDPSKVTRSDDLSGRHGVGATAVPRGFVIDDDPDVRQSVSFVPMISPPSMLRPFPLVYNLQLETATADPFTSMDWYFRRAADGSFRIRMEANATNPVAVSRFFGIVPAINYSVDFHFAADRSVTVSGTHDGFPAYDFYLQRRQFHRYDPIAVGASPLSLFGFVPDVAVSEQRLQ
jgi:hypothetical protein